MSLVHGKDIHTGKSIGGNYFEIDGQPLAACRREQRAVRPVVMRLSVSFMAQAGTTERSEGASEIGPVMVTE